MGEITSSSSFTFPVSSADDLIKDLTASNPDLYLLFEASGIGSGELVLVLKKDGTTICESPSVYLDLKDIKKMYEHYTVGDTTDMAPGDIPTTATEVNGFSYTSSSPEEDDYLLFVHGWRMRTWERRYFAETVYKRLFWAKYKGRFGFFSWPTEWVDTGYFMLPVLLDPHNYDRSEEKAWNSAAGLHNLLASLNTQYSGKVRVMAHSMGNVLTSEALRQEAESSSPGEIVHTYVASQAASVAHAYDAVNPETVETDLTTQTPEAYADYPPTGDPYYDGIASVAGNIINFYNGADNALNGWNLNQDLKPDDPWGSDPGWGYGRGSYWDDEAEEWVDQFDTDQWYRGVPPDAVALTFPNDRYEIYSFIAEARSLALGADEATAGEILDDFDLSNAPNSYGNGAEEHSAQFLSTIMRRHWHWEDLLDECAISTE